MAKRQQEAQQQDDPSVRHLKGGAPEYPEGTHPPVSPSEQTWGPGRFSYADMLDEDKPDPSTVAQTLESDPVQDEAQEALRDAAQSSAEASSKQDDGS